MNKDAIVLLAAALLTHLLPAEAALKPVGDRLPNVDRRPGLAPAAPRSQEEQTAAVARLRSAVPGARVDFDDLVGSPKSIASPRSFLGYPDGQRGAVSAAALAAVPVKDTNRVITAFLQEHRDLFGHGAEVLLAARVKRDFITPHNGLRTVVWEQQVDDIPLFDSVLVAHTTRQGELVSITSHFLPDPATAADVGTPNRRVLLAAPIITARQAVAAAAGNLGETVAEQELTANPPAVAGPEQHQKFKGIGIKGEAEVRLVWLPMHAGALRLCWDVILTGKTSGEMFRVLVDVRTGEVWLRRGLTEYISDATYRVYTSDSPSPFSPGSTIPQTNQPPLVSRTLVTLPALNTNASPNGWITDGDNETRGNNVDAHLDRNDDDSPDLPRPQGSPFRVFDFPLDLNLEPTSSSAAGVVQLFYWCNWMHDKLYELGFTEAAGNFQVSNFGRGGIGNDAVQADAQDGGGFNNANMSTPSDGSSPRMQMYLFNGPTPDRDGDLDAEVVLHEYTHGLSNRRVGGGVGLNELQSRGMGEGWSDFYGLALLSEPGDNINGNYAAGGYLSYRLSGLLENYYYGIRRYPYTTDMSKNPLTFKDIDPAQAIAHTGVPLSPLYSPFSSGSANEVHAQGEVWCVALWEARANLIARHGFATGNQLILQLVTDGMGLSAANPNFLQARDAILQADLVNNGGANRNDLWAAFAKRGMGASATSPASFTTTGVHESFDVPDDLSIVPASGFTASGPVGGPFSPGSTVFVLTNTGAAALNWTAANTSLWLNITLVGGTLTPGGPAQSVAASLTAAVSGLPLGVYTTTVRFTNTTSGVGMGRQFVLRVGQLDYFTELFTGDNDLDFLSLTFKPDGGANFYSACRQVVTNFPTDPAGGTDLLLTSHSTREIVIASTNRIRLYGQSTDRFYLSSDGHLTFNQADSSGAATLANHFTLPRVSAQFSHLHPGELGGRVLHQELSDRVAVTFENVRNYDDNQTNSFQIELFFDGRIRLTYLRLGSTAGLTGLSRGLGLPADLLESDFTSYPTCPPPDDLLVTPVGGLVSTGTPGGPFVPPGTDYILRNVGTNPLSWAAITTQPWITASPAGGSLLPATTNTVTLLLNTNAQSLATGTYTASLIFSNQITAVAQPRVVQLTVVNPTLSISDALVREGNTGLTNLIFQVSLQPPATQSVTVAYATSDGTASAGSDYVATNGVLAFLAGETNKFITVRVYGDTNQEPGETVLVNLSGAMSAILGDAQGVGAILTDDTPMVAVFDNPIYVDTTSGGSGAESDNVQASLTNLGFQVVTFTDIPVAAVANSVLLFPEFEVRSLALDLTGTERAALSNFVSQGGLMIVLGHGPNAGTFINTVFGLTVVESSQSAGGTVYTRTAVASGTQFADDPPTITGNNGQITLGLSSLPTGSLGLYTNGTQGAVVEMLLGNGKVIYLGWDWYNAAPVGTNNGGWLTVLESAVLEAGPAIPRPPLIFAHPASQTVPLGGAANFSVVAGGSLPLSYQWSKGGAPIPQATNASLTLATVQTNDGGLYSVLITNLYGSLVSSNALLTVQVPLPPTVPAGPVPAHLATGVSVHTLLSWNSNATLALIDPALANPSGKLNAHGQGLGAEPVKKFSWFQNGVALKEGVWIEEPVNPPARQSLGGVLINFNDLTEPCGFLNTVRLTGRYASQGVTFAGPGGNDGAAIVDQCGSWGVTGHSPPNFLGFNTGAALSDGGIPRGPETLSFSTPVSQVSMLVGSGTSAGAVITVQAFNAGNGLVSSTNVILTSVMSPATVSGAGISRVVVSGTASVFVIDDLSFDSDFGAATYDVYLGTNAAALSRIASNLSQPSFNPGTLAFNTAYYWRVVASNAVGSVTGAVWTFTTTLDEVRLASATASVAETGGAATITVLRENPAGGVLSVNYLATNGTATAGSDYTAVSGTLTFAAGMLSTNFQVPILDDNLGEGNETVLLRLSQPSAGVLLTAPSNAVLTILDNEGPPDFQIVGLSASNSAVVDHDFLTSDDRGGIAVSASQAFVTGDGATARFNAANLTGGASLGRIVDGLCTDLSTEAIYALGNGSVALTSSGGTVTSLIALDGTTGQPTGVVLPLSQSFTMPSFGNGIFSGYGRVVVHNGTRVYDIYLPSATVTDRGTMAQPSWWGSESWSIWGVAEYFGGTLYLTYRESGTQRIVRSRVTDGVVTAVATFSNLSDMASLTVSPSRNRWYFHYEGGGQFGGSSETLGYADAQFAFVSTNPPSILSQPASQTGFTGSTATFTVGAAGSQPLFYQWRKGGVPIAQATNASLILANIQITDNGSVYSVVITNAYGAVTSTGATLTVIDIGSGFFDDFEPGIDLVQWSAFGGTVGSTILATNYGGSVSPVNSLWFGDSGSRFAITRSLNTTAGGAMSFYLRIAAGSSSTWETADLPGEGIVLEYSVNNGTSWNIIGTYDTTIYNSWTLVQMPIPAAAQAASVLFRWRQLSHSGSGLDHWALDDVRINTVPTTPTVHHFTWGAIAPTQQVNVPFLASLRAEDNLGNAVSNFTGPVAISGLIGGGVTTSNMLGSPVHSMNSAGTFTIGHSFTPSADIVITHVRHYWGTKVSIWTDAGVLLSTQNVVSPSATWSETPLSAPVALQAGNRYRVAAYSGGGSYYWRTDGVTNFAHGTLEGTYYSGSDSFPTTTNVTRWFFVDLRYTVGSVTNVPVGPIVASNFVSGVWTGSVTVLSTGNGVRLRADDASNHFGISTQFNVIPTVPPGAVLTVANGASHVIQGASALPYPSTILVTNVGSWASKVTVTLSNLAHAWPDDLDILLVGPLGQKVMLMSDAVGDSARAFTNLTLTFDDNAVLALPESGPISSGAYRPTDIDTRDLLPAPAPLGPYGTSLNVFARTNADGLWSLYIADDYAPTDGGVLANGWSLRFEVGLPQLVASREGPNMAVSWPASFSGQLEWAPDLNSPLTWTPLFPHPPVIQVGDRKFVVLPVAGFQRFYRLRPD
jgi:hypothetical protein